MPFVYVTSPGEDRIERGVIVDQECLLAWSDLEGVITVVRDLIGSFTNIVAPNLDPRFIAFVRETIH